MHCLFGMDPLHTTEEDTDQRSATSWDRFVPSAKPKTLRNNGKGRWPMVRTKACIAGYTTATRLVCDIWTYDRLKKKLPANHPIHRLDSIEYVDYEDWKDGH